MTITDAEREAFVQRLQDTIGKRMEAAYLRTATHDLSWDEERWAILLDWIQGPFRLAMYQKALDGGGTVEGSPIYLIMEGFDRARLSGKLEHGEMIRLLFSLFKEFSNVLDDGMRGFRIEFKENPEAIASLHAYLAEHPGEAPP